MGSFKDFLYSKLSHAEFETLHEKMGITPTRKTQMINRPESMTIEMIEKLVAMINENNDDDLSLLVDDMVICYHAGWDRMSLTKINNYFKQYGRMHMMSFGEETDQDNEE